MRVTKPDELRLVATALDALRRVKHSRIMRGRAEGEDAREYILLAKLIANADASINRARDRERIANREKAKQIARDLGLPENKLP
jgi:hypothetical protein